MIGGKKMKRRNDLLMTVFFTDILITVLLFSGCRTVTTPAMVTTETKPITPTMEITTIDYSDYYGAKNLLEFPASVIKWVETTFIKEEMEDPKLNVWWGDDDGRAYAEVSYTVKDGYAGAGEIETFSGSYGYDWNKLNQEYGEYAKFQTMKFKHEQKVKAEQRMVYDPAFREVIEFVKELCEEFEYDWSNYSKYQGATVKKTPEKKYAVCSGYSSEVEKVLELNCVQAVQFWSAPGHAWNVLVLNDNRLLYVDATWFDNEHINETTGEIIQLDDYGWENVTFNEEIFKFSDISYGTGEFTHALGKFDKEITKEKRN